MAIDPNILLQGRIADISAPLRSGLEAYSLIQQGQLNKQKAEQESALNAERLAQMQYQADLLKSGVTAQRLNPYIENQDYEGFKRELEKSTLDGDDKEWLDTYARAKRWDQLKTIGDQTVQLARDSGVFEQDLASRGGYTPAGLTMVNEYQKALAEAEADVPGAAEKARLLAEQIAKTRYYSGGGGVEMAYQPVTGQAAPLPVEATGRSTTGALPPPTPGVQGESRVNLEAPIEGDTSIRPMGASPDEVIRLRDSARAAGIKLGELEAKIIADLRSFNDTLEANIAGLNDQFPQLTFSRAAQDAPNTGIAKLASQVYSTFFTNDAAAAEADLESFLQSLAATVPFPPGSQSNAELDARLARVGNIMKQGVSPERKLDIATRYLAGQEAVARVKKQQAERLERKLFGKSSISASVSTDRPGNQPVAPANQQVYEVDW